MVGVGECCRRRGAGRWDVDGRRGGRTGRVRGSGLDGGLEEAWAVGRWLVRRHCVGGIIVVVVEVAGVNGVY